MSEARILKCIAPVQSEHAEAIYALLCTHWPGIDRACRNGRIAHSHLDWEVSRIGFLGAELVTYWGVYALHMRIGAARVRTAGINLPITHPAHRGRGLMPLTMARSLEAMRERGYGLSVINNTHAYFQRFGYVFAWPQTHFFVKTEDLPDAEPRLRLREADIRDLMGREDLAALYNRQNETLTGTAVRPTYRRGKHPGDGYEPGYLFEDERGQVAGYLIDGPPPRSDQPYWHSDSAGDTDERLRILGRLARQHRCKGVYFHRLAYASDLASRLRRLNCDMDVQYRRDGGYLIRIVDLRRTLEDMAGELARRLSRSHLCAWGGELLLRAGDQEAALLIDRSQVQVAATARTPHAIEGDAHLAQLIIGTHAPLETMDAAGLSARGEARSLAEALFPPQHPQMPNEDL